MDTDETTTPAEEEATDTEVTPEAGEAEGEGEADEETAA